MTKLDYGKKCKKNKDCNSNICQMTYKEGIPQGRYCLEGKGEKYTKACNFPRDCKSNNCVKIYNSSNKFVGKKCLKAKRMPKKESAMTNLFGESPKSDYGVNNEEHLQADIQQFGEKGPVADIIIHVFNIIGDFFSMLVYNVRECSWDYERDLPPEKQGLLYSVFMIVSTTVYKIFMGPVDGLVWGGIQSINYDEENNKCNSDSAAFDMWYVRTIITILFPPMGVFMAKGLYGMPEIVLSCILTMLFYFPGLIYSFAVISGSKIDIPENSLIRHF